MIAELPGHFVRPDARPATGAIGAGAGDGEPQGGNQAAGNRWRGWRTGMVPVPPVSRRGRWGRLGKMMVRGPGQNFSISRRAKPGTSRAT